VVGYKRSYSAVLMHMSALCVAASVRSQLKNDRGHVLYLAILVR
jgi:hypothetical protein